MTFHGGSEEPRAWRWALLLPALFLLVALLAALAGFGSRWGLWHFRTGFSLLRWAMYGAIAVGLAAAATSAFAAARLGWLGGEQRDAGALRALLLAGVTLVAVLTMLAVPLQWQSRANRAPPIHDITTDMDDPPQFVAIAPLRADAPNPLAYPGEEAAVLQRAAYPEIRPLVLSLPPHAAYERAMAVIGRMGWQVVAADAGEGRIEATDRTFWFGFRDDVAIRLTPTEGRTIVDVRSKSRVGRGDVGTNARRIRAFLDQLE